MIRVALVHYQWHGNPSAATVLLATSSCGLPSGSWDWDLFWGGILQGISASIAVNPITANGVFGA